MSKGIELAPLLTKVKVDINGFKDEMQEVKAEAISQAKRISKEMEQTAKVGANLSDVGGKLTKGLTVPLIGAGTAVTKLGMDFENGFAKVSTLLDENVVDFNKYSKDILRASDDSKVAVDEFSESVYSSISAGVDQTKAIGFTTNAMKLAKGGFTDGAKAVDILTTAINGYSLKAEDSVRISDLLITTQNLGKTTVDELASSMGAVIPIANSVNFGVEELSASYAQLTKNGIATAESGTYLKSMLSELGKSGSITDKVLKELSGKGFAELKKEGTGTVEILGMLDSYARANNMSLKDMFGSVEAGSAALVLYKNSGLEYNEMLDGMASSAGATQKAFDKMDATKVEKLKGSLNELKNAGIQLGTNLLPLVTEFAEGLSDLVGRYNDLSPEQQNMILKLGGIAAATGPVVKVTGNLITGYTKLKPLLVGANTLLSKSTPLIGDLGLKLMDAPGIIGKVGTAMASAATSSGGLLSGLGGLVVSAAPFALAAGGVAVAVKGISDGLSQDLIPKVDLFEDRFVSVSQTMTVGGQQVVTQAQTNFTKISDTTKTAVQSYMEMDDEMTRVLYDQQINHAVITDEIANSTINGFKNMAKTIIESQNESYKQQLTDYRSFFNESSALSVEREAEILSNVTNSHNQRQKTVQDCMDKISDIYQTAADEHRELTAQEQEDIQELQNQMRDDAINALSETEEEAAVIRERMKDYQGRLTAEMTSDMISKANEARDGEIQAAEEKYDEVIKQANRMKEAGLITEEEYKSMRDEAEKTRTETVNHAKKACNDILKEIENSTPGIEDEVDLQTGKIKNGWDRLSDYASGAWDYISGLWSSSNAKANSITGLANGFDGSHFNGLSYVPFDGYNARLHKGERVLTEEQNKAYTAGLDSSRNSPNISITGNTFNVRDDSDIEKIARALYDLQIKEQRGLGFV